MPLICLACGRDTLAIVESLELGPDGDSDENTLQSISCSYCDFVGVANYAESRRGREEHFHHYGARTTVGVFAEVTSDIRSCPSARDHRCECSAHAKYRKGQERGVIRPLAELPLLEPAGALQLSR